VVHIRYLQRAPGGIGKFAGKGTGDYSECHRRFQFHVPLLQHAECARSHRVEIRRRKAGKRKEEKEEIENKENKENKEEIEEIEGREVLRSLAASYLRSIGSH